MKKLCQVLIGGYFASLFSYNDLTKVKSEKNQKIMMYMKFKSQQKTSKILSEWKHVVYAERFRRNMLILLIKSIGKEYMRVCFTQISNAATLNNRSILINQKVTAYINKKATIRLKSILNEWKHIISTQFLKQKLFLGPFIRISKNVLSNNGSFTKY